MFLMNIQIFRIFFFLLQALSPLTQFRCQIIRFLSKVNLPLSITSFSLSSWEEMPFPGNQDRKSQQEQEPWSSGYVDETHDLKVVGSNPSTG